MSIAHQDSVQNLLGQSTSSINTVQQQDLLLANYNLPGLRINGRMSNVRRFFCLFVTFDLLFTTLFWIICVLINGQSIMEGLDHEIVNYSFKTSMFDIVVCSGLRFLLLLLFYAVIYIQHYWMVAITTLLTSAFLVGKSLVYQWGNSTSNTSNSNYPFQVLLLLISFLLAWTEAWFIDFSVIPQEERAKNLLRAVRTSNSVESIPGIDPAAASGRLRDYLSQCATESVANFYSPLQSPYESDEEEHQTNRDGGVRAPSKLTKQEIMWQSLGVDAVLRAYDLMRSAGWQFHSRHNENDVVTTKTTPAGRKIYRITGILPAPTELIFKDVVQNVENMPSWNPAISAVRIVQSISSSCDIIHQIASDVPGGMVKSRDFVMSRHWRRIVGSPLDEWSVCWITGGISVIHPEVPVNKQHVRGENGPGCWAFCEPRNSPLTTSFQWVLETDLKGWLPRAVVDSAIASVMAQQLVSLRVHCSTSLSPPSSIDQAPSSVGGESALQWDGGRSLAESDIVLAGSLAPSHGQSLAASLASQDSSLAATTQSLPPVTFRDCHEILDRSLP